MQLNSTSNVEENWRAAEKCIRGAAGEGAQFIVTPENTNFLGPHPEKVRTAEPLDGPTCQRFAGLAAELGVSLILGSFNEVGPDSEHCYNTSVLFGPDGEIQASYRKIHLFDVDLNATANATANTRVRFVESDTVAPGNRAVICETNTGVVGLSICYDLRFGELYRTLVDQGAEIIVVPSAFTAPTGQAHWRTLLRARAIETQCWLLAAAQTGHHDDDGLRESHGHSMILDPWGTVVAEIPEGVGWAVAEIDLEKVAEVRRAMPVASHRRTIKS